MATMAWTRNTLLRLTWILLNVCFERIRAFGVRNSHDHSAAVQFERTPCHTSTTVCGSRRDWIKVFGTLVLVWPKESDAVGARELSSDPVASLTAARSTLEKLLDNWERAVIDCTFADVPRDLLEQKNKDLLLEKASTFALFDKSVSVETCKTTNRVVRDYLGATGIGPLVGLEKQMKRALDRVSPNFLDEYVEISENIEQNLSKARSLAYTSGVADFSSVNNFQKEEVASVLQNESNLEQTRLSIEQIVDGLKRIDAMFDNDM